MGQKNEKPKRSNPVTTQNATIATIGKLKKTQTSLSKRYRKREDACVWLRSVCAVLHFLFCVVPSHSFLRPALRPTVDARLRLQYLLCVSRREEHLESQINMCVKTAKEKMKGRRKDKRGRPPFLGLRPWRRSLI